MITPKLEELILKGRASFRTYVSGGGQKCTLNIKQDHFIIITDITYFNSMHVDRYSDLSDGDLLLNQFNTQVTIFSNKAYNRFMFRNNFAPLQTQNGLINMPTGNTTINTYLLHTEDVSFTFSKGKDFRNISQNIAPAKNPAQSVPSDYGKDGLNNSIVVSQQMIYQAPAVFATVNPLDLTGSGLTNGTFRELAFPICDDTNIPREQQYMSFAYDILHVNYVEIKGKPTDITNR